jgi:hypothetical protein
MWLLAMLLSLLTHGQGNGGLLDPSNPDSLLILGGLAAQDEARRREEEDAMWDQEQEYDIWQGD